jgi:hypothetical protein
MNRFLSIATLIFASGCASDFGSQGQSHNIASTSEFKFESGISGDVPRGLCQFKQLKSERDGYGIVFFSNCNPNNKNKSLVTLTYLKLDQTQSVGSFLEDEFNKSFASFQKNDGLNPMIDQKSLRILRVKENYIFMAKYYVPRNKNLPNFRAKAYLNSIMLSVKVPKIQSSARVNFYESVSPILRPRKRPSVEVYENRSFEKINSNDRKYSIPRPIKRPLIF